MFSEFPKIDVLGVDITLHPHYTSEKFFLFFPTILPTNHLALHNYTKL